MSLPLETALEAELTGRQDMEIMELLTQDTTVTEMTAGCKLRR